MPDRVCPTCHELIAAEEDAACPRCGKAVPKQITSESPAPSSDAIQVEAPPEAVERRLDPSTGKYASWDDFRLTSPANERERMALAMRPMPDLRDVVVLPLPENTPPKTEAWGQPLGTLSIPGASNLSLWIAEAVLIGLGIFLVLWGSAWFVVTVLPIRDRRGEPGQLIGPPIQVGNGIVMIYLGIRLARQRAMLGLTLWIFEEGLLFERGGEWKAVRFEDVVDFKSSRETGLPLFWLAFEDEAPIVLSVGHCPEVIPLMEYVEIRMAAAQLLPRLKSIWHGTTEKFGVIVLSQEGIEGPGFFAPWSDVNRVIDDPTTLFIDCEGRPHWIEVRYRDVSFPSLVIAIAHVLIEEHTRLTSMETDSSKPEA